MSDLARDVDVVAPAGIDRRAAPTATILPSVTTSVPFSMGAPAIGMMRALMKARVSADTPVAVASTSNVPHQPRKNESMHGPAL